MKKYLNLRLVTSLVLVVALASCGSSRTTTSRYPYPGSTYPYPGSTYPESYPYPGSYPSARYPRQSPPVVVYRQPQKVYVPVEKRRYEKRDHWDNRNNNNRRRDRDYDRDRDHHYDHNKGNGRSNGKR